MLLIDGVKMLLIDGVKYELWIPQKEVEEFHPIIKEHYKEIFGTNSIFIEGDRLESDSGMASIPDGFIITFGNAPQWHIVEVELSSHQPYDHIVNQVGRFINGINNTVTQKKIVESIYHEITENKQRKVEFEEAIGSGEIYKFLSDIISKSPVLTIIIEKRTQELEEAINLLKYSPIKIVEFQTFAREGVGIAVHAHLFEPFSSAMKPSKPTGPTQPKVSSREQLYKQIFTELVEGYSAENPSWRKTKVLPQSRLGFGAGKSGLWFNWAFRGNKRFSVELYIDTGDQARNKQYFDKIKQCEARVRSALAYEISWESLDERKASRIAIYTHGDIQEAMSDATEKERLIKWGTEAMGNFSGRLKEIIEKL